jgi:NAD(P)-dependent dehydrogenase (short-subunit alcohol dehydrogenase family)
MTLRGKTAIVTGGSSGVGKATVHALVAEGVHVVAVARGEARLLALREELPSVQIVAADAADPTTAPRLLRELAPELVVLAAGVPTPMGPFDEMSWETFAEAWNTDLKATFHFLQAAFALPLPSSTIAIVSSGAARNGSFLSGGYAGAKRMQWLLADYAAKIAAARKLDLRAVAVVPTQLVEGTDIATVASTTYAGWLGIDAREYMDRFEIPLRPAGVADAILAVLRREIAAGTHAVAVSGKGIEPLA